MSSSKREDVLRLLRTGLEHYGKSELESAVVCWERARTLDPDNQAARDYLRTAYDELDDTPVSVPQPTSGDYFGESQRGGSSGGPGVPDPACEARLELALDCYHGGRIEEAWETLKGITEDYPDHPQARRYLDLLRNHLRGRWVEELGDFECPVELTAPAEEWLHLNLSPDEGFVLSLIDGKLSFDQLIVLSHLDRFRALEILVGFARRDIVST